MIKENSSWRRYFWEGQQLTESTCNAVPHDADFLDKIIIKHRKYIAFLIPFGIMQTIWWVTAYRYNWFPLFTIRWQMPVVMFFGSTVAGMTSEGGGAVAFPIMTLVLKIDPSVARDFSLLIQSAGMTCAMSVILIMQIQIEKRAVIFGTMGSVPGLIIGSLFIDAHLTSQQKKMLFVSIWFSFAVALFILNVQHRRKTYDIIPNFKPWKALVLIITGFVGGIFTAFAGSGVDICVFSMLTLLFRVTEKTATPTSVILMGINTMVGVYWRAVWEGNISSLAWEYATVSVPIAVTMAPLGSFLGSHLHRQILATFIYVLEGLAVIGFIITRPATNLMINGVIIVLVAFIFFLCISKTGKKLAQNEEALRCQIPESLNDLII